MSSVLAAGEGGYQLFELGGSEWALLAGAAGVGVLALVIGLAMVKAVLAKEQGTPEMVEIAEAIQEGALAYLKRQFRTIGIIVVPLAAVVFFTSTEVVQLDRFLTPGDLEYSRWESGAFRTLTFIVGCVASGFIGFLGMWLAVRGNVRTAAAARREDFAGAMQVAFRTGSVAGLFTAGLGLLGSTVIIMVFQNSASIMLVGFAFGGSLLALFLRVGGGIFTKAADVGADLVGKVEAGIPEDDPRNPATIADNVGDNVGDCAGMASDLFESYAVVLIASVILGVSAFTAIQPEGEVDLIFAAQGLVFPIALMAVGLLASIIGIFSVKARAGEVDALKPINRGIYLAQALAVVGAAGVAFLYVGSPDDLAVSAVGPRLFGAIVIGVVLGFAVSKITEYFTSTKTKPVRDIAESARTGPATVVLSGLSSGMESAVWALIAIAGAIMSGLLLGDGNTAFSLYLIALAGVGMLSTTGIVVAEDTFGPVADNAAGIAEMAGEFEGEPERIMVGLDAVGNTTKAVTKGFAIGSAVVAAVALFASFVETIAGETGLAAIALRTGDSVFETVPINVADPKTFVGLILGGTVAFLFSSLAILAVSRTAGIVVEEVRKQFREHPGIMDGTEKPDHGAVIDICTSASLRELATPALLAVLMPVIVGFALGPIALGAFLASGIIVAALMANFQSNAGGAWDNAKKFIEDGAEGGKGSDAHKAAVIGDTVGDPFKDTSGPALNPLMKVMNLISLLVLPAVVALNPPDLENVVGEGSSMAWVVAAACLIVLIGAILFSKRSGQGIAAAAAETSSSQS
ncbi:MAG: sodium-translocating pyrophosphatase [Acidimicrobiia bacterium]|nr:sodium-translocating pyrophosphatase [Acidimicrobiia bacterium]